MKEVTLMFTKLFTAIRHFFSRLVTRMAEAEAAAMAAGVNPAEWANDAALAC